MRYNLLSWYNNRMLEDINAVLCVFKPAGLSSAEVIRRFKRIYAFRGKIGHAGTLDEFASGVLLLLLGKATKQFDALQQEPKTYEAVVRLGYSSPTLDVEGPLTAAPVFPEPTKEAILAVLPQFLGEIEQAVPAYSAAKHQGKALYAWARAGRTIAKSKKVQIYALELVSYRYPLLTLRVVCGSGTYIRQLGADVAQQLGTQGFLASLVRTAVGEYTLADAQPVEKLKISASTPPML